MAFKKWLHESSFMVQGRDKQLRDGGRASNKFERILLKP